MYWSKASSHGSLISSIPTAVPPAAVITYKRINVFIVPVRYLPAEVSSP